MHGDDRKERCPAATLFPDHADLYHTGIIVHDLERAKAGRSRGQAAPTTSGTGPTTSRHRAPSGLCIELVDRSLRETLFGRELAED